MNNKLILILSFIIFLACMTSTSAATIISSCGQNLNAPGAYMLNQSINSTATCLTTNSSNVQIDCAGNTITYGTAGTASSIGINALATVSQNNVTIENCIITKSSGAGAGTRGIMLTRFANSTITNNTIRVNGTSSNFGIYVLTTSDGINISRNAIVTSGSSSSNYGIYLNTGSADSIIEYNNITTGKSTATTDNYGIYATDPRAKIAGNTITTFGTGDSNYGILSSLATGTKIVNNTIYTSGTTGNNRGIYLTSSDFNLIANNTINTTGQASPGIYVLSSGGVNILNNGINSSADSIYMSSATLSDFTLANISRDNTRFGRNITVYGGGALTLPCPNNTIIDNPADGALKFFGCNNITIQNWYRPNKDTDGLLFVNSDNNKIINNTINGGIDGLDMFNAIASCDNNLIANNTFSSFGYIDAYAIHIYGVNNTISGNNLSTLGITSGNNGINIQNDFNNITNNVISTGGTSANIGINLEAGAINNLIQGNIITTSGTSGNTGIYFVSTCMGNIVRNNTVTATGTTTANLGIRLVTNSNNNTIENNTFYTKGLTTANNGIDLSSSSNNIFRFNNVYAGYGAGTTDNDAISLVSSKNNTFMGNIIFANGTATSITSSSIFLQSSSTNNTFINNVITKSVGNAIEIDFSATYPSGNTFKNNSLNNVSGSDLFFLDAGINGTTLIDQPIGKYNFTGIGGTIILENTQFGKIEFISPINGSGDNLTNDIQIKSDFVQVSSSKPGLNATANVRLYNLATNFYIPIIKRNGIYECNSTTSPACVNLTSLNAGNVSFSVSGWSNYSISNSTDTIPPTITIISPQNISYAVNSVFLNYSASDNLAVGSCWYSIDTSPNISLPGCTTATISGLNDGSHTINVYANDSSGNVNYSSVSFSIVSNPPQWSNMQSLIVSVYSPASSYFNVTWTSANSIAGAFVESNFSGIARNYSMYSLGGNVYGFNATLPAGTFYWKSYANDSYGNMNSTNIEIFSIAKAGNPINMYINGNLNQNLSVNYGTQTNVTALALTTTSLTRDSISVPNPEISVLGAKPSGYAYIATAQGNQNYTTNATTYYLFINKTSPNLNLLINNVPADLTVNYGTQTNVTGFELNYGDGDVSYNLYRNGSIISNPDVSTLNSGVYGYVYNSSGGENYTSYSIGRTLTINKISPNLHLFLNGNESNLSLVYGSAINISGTSQEGLDLTLYRNGIVVSNPDSSSMSAGIYNYTLVFSGNQNYNPANVSYSLNIGKAVPNIHLSFNGAESDIAVSVGDVVEINASDSSQNVALYEDSVLVDNSSSASIERNYTSPGNIVWLAVLQESENYSYLNITRTISVIDADAPHFSNLKVSPSSSSSYSPNKNYQFNSTWIDNIGIDNVILQFNGVNYTYSSNQLKKNGNEYYFDMNNLAVGSYNYRWYANDTSGNLISTSLQNYVIQKGIAALFLTITPSSSSVYGTRTSVSCVANNPESSPVLARNMIEVQNPDQNVLAAGTYNYACTSVATNNYTSDSKTATLTITKAAPVISLKLNDVENDLVFSGGEVNVSASLVSPSFGILNLTIDNQLVSSALSPVQNSSTFSTTGEHLVNALYEGNDNYTLGSLTRKVTVQSSSGNGGNGGGGGAPQTAENKTVINDIGVDFLNLGDVLISPGESKTLELSMKNSGRTFLNKCQIISSNNWLDSNESKNIGIGEIAEFIVNINAPIDAEMNDSTKIELRCLEKTIPIPLKVIVLKSGLNVEINEMNLVSKGNLEINYTARGNSEFSQGLIFSVTDSEGNLISEKSDVISVGKDARRYSIILDVTKANKGLLKITVAKTDDKKPVVEEFFVYDASSVGVTGFAFLNRVNSTLTFTVLLVIAFIVIAFFVVKRIQTLRKWGNNISVKNLISNHGSGSIDGKEHHLRKIKVNMHDPDKDWRLNLL